MGRISILYHTDTNNTERMAELVEEGTREIGGHEIRRKPIADATAEDVIWADGIALGSPTHMGGIPWQMKRFWDETMREHWSPVDGKIGCAFCSQGGWGGGADLNCMQLMIVMMNYGFLT